MSAKNSTRGGLRAWKRGWGLLFDRCLPEKKGGRYEGKFK